MTYQILTWEKVAMKTQFSENQSIIMKMNAGTGLS
jgi:hypothetical protein